MVLVVHIVGGYGFQQQRGMLRQPLRLCAASSTETETNLSTGLTFDVNEFPTSIDEMVTTYQRWSASQGQLMSDEEARQDVQCFIADENLAKKWQPILQKAIEDKNKLTPVAVINIFTAYALPIAVGFTFLPILRSIGEHIPFINDEVLPRLDGGLDLVKKGVQKAIELPICLEFGDC